MGVRRGAEQGSGVAVRHRPVARGVARDLRRRSPGEGEGVRQNPHRRAVASRREVPGDLRRTLRLPRRSLFGPGLGRPPGRAAAAAFVEQPEREFRGRERFRPIRPVVRPAAGDGERELRVVAVFPGGDLFVERPEPIPAPPRPSREAGARAGQRTRRAHPAGDLLRPTESVPGREREERPFRSLRQPGATGKAVGVHRFCGRQGVSTGILPTLSKSLSRCGS